MFLVFQLRAPLASFGSNQAELRTSERTPRKSAVSGLLAAALGITRENTDAFQELVDSFSMAVATLKDPLKLTDFHTVQSPVQREASSRAEQVAEIGKRQISKAGYSGTIVTRREYLQDGHWVIALYADASQLIKLKDALEFPIFTLYVGRKSCALSANLLPVVVDAAAAEDAIAQWAHEVNVALPANAPMNWDRNVATVAQPLTQVRKNDVRRRLLQNHFSARDVLQGTAVFAEVA